jgi:crotonobetainyl-CoA:carnitine CoA-transferase CaiB-like acyl-CoA transferase
VRQAERGEDVVHQPLAGIKVVEVAQFTFTPAGGAVLADWGAEVIKVEHAVTGDAQRGMRSQPVDGSWQPVMEHPNRGKRSIGLALEHAAAHETLLDLCRDADVFLTNFLPDARRKLKIDVADIRAANPNIIYVRGSAHGPRGPWAERGGYDGTAYWCRMGSAWGTTSKDAEHLQHMPAGAYGDSTGGMTIAGGVAAALLGRERTGEPSVVDVSLMSAGAWAFGLAIANSAMTGESQDPPVLDGSVNPLANCFRTKDDRWINFTMMQPSRYFADVCRHLDLDHVADDERFVSFEAIMANAADATALFNARFLEETYDYWVERLQSMEGQWAPVQSPVDIVHDPQMTANGYLVDVLDADGVTRQLVASPVQFDEQVPSLTRAPLFAEHTDAVLRELGRSDEDVLQLKIDGAAT